MTFEQRHRGLTTFAMLVVAVCAFAGSSTIARADGGEAGLVVQHGDGTVDTYCIGFSGNSISGSDLLAKANLPVVQFDGLVCAVGTQEGCFVPTSIPTCVCHSYAPENTYWAFFQQRYGKSWQYSSFGLNDPRAALEDGDMEAWRWGKASPNSAPTPPAMTFEQVCGHAPRGGAPVEASVAQQPTPTLAPPLTTIGGGAAATPANAATPPTSAAATGAITSDATASATGAATLTGENTPLIRNHGTATAVPQAPATGTTGGGGSSSQLYAFIAIAGALLATIASALIWGRRRGA